MEAVRWLWCDDRFFVAALNHLPPPDCDCRSCFISFPCYPWNCLPKHSAGYRSVMKVLVPTLSVTFSQRLPGLIYSSWTHHKWKLFFFLLLQNVSFMSANSFRMSSCSASWCRFFFFFLVLLSSGPTVDALSLLALTVALPLPAGRGRGPGGGHLDLDREERLHQPAVLQDVRRLHLHTGPGRSRRHGNGRAGLLRHLQGEQEAAASGERLRHTRSISSGDVRDQSKQWTITQTFEKVLAIKAINQDNAFELRK